MARKRRRFPSKPLKKRYNFDDISETSDTNVSEATDSSNKQNEYAEYYKVPPPFKGNGGSRPITWDDVKLSSKIFGAIFLFLVTIVIPSVWYASRVETNIKVIKSDVREIKVLTNELTKATIKNTDRIDHVEKTMSYLTNRIDSRYDSKQKTQSLDKNKQNARIK